MKGYVDITTMFVLDFFCVSCIL